MLLYRQWGRSIWTAPFTAFDISTPLVRHEIRVCESWIALFARKFKCLCSQMNYISSGYWILWWCKFFADTPDPSICPTELHIITKRLRYSNLKAWLAGPKWMCAANITTTLRSDAPKAWSAIQSCNEPKCIRRYRSPWLEIKNYTFIFEPPFKWRY